MTNIQNRTINITHSPLFENLAFLQLDDFYMDAHNDFHFSQFQFEQQTQRLTITFRSLNESPSIVEYVLEEVEFIECSITQFQQHTQIILDNLYRGRFESNNILLEKSENGKVCFYIDFIENILIELLTSKVIVNYYPHHPSYIWHIWKSIQ